MQTLQERFEIPGTLKIDTGAGGLTRLVISTESANAEIYLHGAHVTHFQPAGAEPVLWMSKSSQFAHEKPIRGGVPICFPWFGPNGQNPSLPAHGFARLRPWDIESVTTDGPSLTVTLELESNESTRALWPHDFRAQHVITIGRTLEMDLIIQNLAAEAIRFEEALHTYLNIGDIHKTSVEGLQGSSYLDKVDAAKKKQETAERIRFSGETDRVYLNAQGTCIVHDEARGRRIEIEKSGSNNTVVWNPWINKSKAMPDFGDEEWPGMVCVETANVGETGVNLAPGATHTMTARVRVK